MVCVFLEVGAFGADVPTEERDAERVLKPWLTIETPYGQWDREAPLPRISLNGVSYDMDCEADSLRFTSQASRKRSEMVAVSKFIMSIKKYWKK